MQWLAINKIEEYYLHGVLHIIQFIQLITFIHSTMMQMPNHNNQQLEILSLEHTRTIDTLNQLIHMLDDEYYLGVDALSTQEPYGPTYTVNIGLVHTIINNIETAAKLIQILRSNPEGKQSDRISVYLMKEELSSPTPKVEEIQEEWDPEKFIQKHRYSTEISLHKHLIRQRFVEKIQNTCKNIYTIKLISDHYEQKSQIEDMDLRMFKIFQNVSVLQLKQSAITDSSIELIRDKLGSVKQVDLSGCYMLTDRGIKLLSECSLVTIILNEMSSIKEQSIVELIKTSSNLNYLQIKQCPNVTQNIFMMIYQTYKEQSSTLKWLEIISDHGIDLYINKLTYLTSSNPIEEITDTELKTLIGEHPPNYTGLFFQNCQELTKQSLELILAKCKGLKRLALSKFFNLTDRLVQDLSLSLSNLVFLDLNRCYNITNNALYYVAHNLQIQYLTLQRCSSITDQGLSHFLKEIQSPQPSRRKHTSLQKQQERGLLSVAGERDRPSKGIKLYHHNRSITSSPVIHQQTNSNLKLKYLNIAYCNKITDQSLCLLCHSAQGLQYLNLSYCDQITNQSIENISQSLVNLQYLNLNHCQGLTDSSISMLATRLGKKLKVLEIEWCQISQNCIRLIAENLTNLRVLNVSYCPSVCSEQVEIIARNMPKIHTLKLQSCVKINEHAFIKLAFLRQLKIISIKQCVQATDTFIKLLTTNNKYIEHLDISWCTQITDKSLFSIAKNCYHLKHLNLNGCIEITDEGIQWLSATVSQIQYLNLILCSRLTDLAVMEITDKMKSLKYLYLCELELLTDISIATISNLDKLELLMLMGCTNVTNSSLVGLLYNLEKLRELNISQCRSVDGKQLKKICQFMANMKVLQISQIQINDQFLDELATHCQKLTHINLCYCNQISDEAVLRLLERVPRLEKIDIQNTNITERTKAKLVHALSARSMANIVLS